MLSYERTREIMAQFAQECYNFWRRQGKDHFEAFEWMLKDLENLQHDPYVPCGEKIDLKAKEDFIRKERNLI